MIKHLRQSLATHPGKRHVWAIVGRQLRARRERLGIDVARMAAELAVSPVVYVDYEAGRRQVPALQLGQVAELFGVHVAWFFKDVGFDVDDDGVAPANADAPSVFCVATEEQRVRALADSFRRLDFEDQQHLLAIAGALSRSDAEKETGD